MGSNERSKVDVEEFNQRAHDAYTKVHSLRSLVARHGAPLDEARAWEVLPRSAWDEAASARALGVRWANARPFLAEADFVAREVRGEGARKAVGLVGVTPRSEGEGSTAALLNLDFGYMERMGTEVYGLTADYSSILDKLGPVDRSPARIVEIDGDKKDAGTERVIILDCVRTFACEDHRKRLEPFIHGCFLEFGNYSQGMAHVAAILLLTQIEDEVIPILRKINKEYIPGHWEHEAWGYARSAYLFHKYVAPDYEPEAVEHFDGIGLWPEMYSRKWFSGLFLGCLHIEHWYPFFRNFLQHGFPYLLACCVQVLRALKGRLLATSDIGALIKILTFDQDAGVPPLAARRMIDGAVSLVPEIRAKIGDDDAVRRLREDMFQQHLTGKFESSQKMERERQADTSMHEPCALCGQTKEVAGYLAAGGPRKKGFAELSRLNDEWLRRVRARAGVDDEHVLAVVFVQNFDSIPASAFEPAAASANGGGGGAGLDKEGDPVCAACAPHAQDVGYAVGQ